MASPARRRHRRADVVGRAGAHRRHRRHQGAARQHRDRHAEPDLRRHRGRQQRLWARAGSTPSPRSTARRGADRHADRDGYQRRHRQPDRRGDRPRPRPVPRPTTTNASGVYSLTAPVGTYDVTASAFGYLTGPAPASRSPRAARRRRTSRSPAPSHSVSGFVSDETGIPLAATVTILGTPIPPATTDASGTYSFASVPDGEYDIQAKPGRAATTADAAPRRRRRRDARLRAGSASRQLRLLLPDRHAQLHRREHRPAAERRRCVDPGQPAVPVHRLRADLHHRPRGDERLPELRITQRDVRQQPDPSVHAERGDLPVLGRPVRLRRFERPHRDSRARPRTGGSSSSGGTSTSAASRRKAWTSRSCSTRTAAS